MTSSLDFPICTACGTQFDPAPAGSKEIHPDRCKICDDPRQFVPPTGQTWTTLQQLRTDDKDGIRHKNKWIQDPRDDRVWYFWTEPKFAIGQRAWLIQTTHGNVMWDMVSLIDQETIDFINSKGGLHAIIISHPHYYTTYVEWSQAFNNCPVHIADDDEEWLCRAPPYLHHSTTSSIEHGEANGKNISTISFFKGPQGATKEIVPGMTAIKAGGHFPGSLLLHWERQLWIADTIVTVPSAKTPPPRPTNQTTFVFQYSIPNCIPLPPGQILAIWNSLREFDFQVTRGAFVGMDLWDEEGEAIAAPADHGDQETSTPTTVITTGNQLEDTTTTSTRKKIKARILQSMKIQVRAEGWAESDGSDRAGILFVRD